MLTHNHRQLLYLNAITRTTVKQIPELTPYLSRIYFFIQFFDFVGNLKQQHKMLSDMKSHFNNATVKLTSPNIIPTSLMGTFHFNSN